MEKIHLVFSSEPPQEETPQEQSDQQTPPPTEENELNELTDPRRWLYEDR